MKAFYFADNNKKLRYGDGRQIRVGRTHKVKGKPKLCVHGLHASKKLIDALYYAPGHHLYLVELSGDFDKCDDKVCATERTYLAHFDSEKLLKEFARKQALINIEKIKAYCSTEDYNLILKWLNTGDRELQSAARKAAKATTWSAVDRAARTAARATAWLATDQAVRAVANKMLTDMVKDKTGWEIKELDWLESERHTSTATR